ncbi:HEPN domain-containing protein [Streptomyces sp. DSM 42041]|uniref:HEPN domain-containing protein n=1 Tax=Streptomyces hazeniae TaxID=3075538 RepID=A0ABU2NNM2_9ACTN|nr:HEPN domain-containing protein [Streptomyces sp. DSM 42041]MDT0377253.1 HEPN domain-containing protein [Streptomyces sp. DSM 42041]
MGAPPKLTARQAFDHNLEDAEMLVDLAKTLVNNRQRRMRREKRERLGEALSLPQKEWTELECLENDRVFVTFKPGHASLRDKLSEQNLRPLLRQALVAACAAIETFCADRVMERYAAAIKEVPPPGGLLELSMTVGDYLTIEEKYQKKGWGLRQVIELEVRQRASPAPAQIGQLFRLVGEKKLMTRVDRRRKVTVGESTAELDRIVARRNQIAHTGDRSGRGRATITVKEVEEDLATIVSVIDALDHETHSP